MAETGNLRLGGVEPDALDATSANVDALDERVSGLESQIENAPDTSAGENAGAGGDAGPNEDVQAAISATNERLDQVEARLAEAPSGTGGGGDGGDASADVGNRIDAMQGNVEDLQQQLQGNIDSLRQQVQGDIQQVQGSIDDIEQQLGSEGDAARSAQSQMQQLQEQVSGLSDSVSGHDDALEALARAIKEVQQTVDDNASSIAAVNDRREQSVGAALALQDVNRALESGGDLAGPTRRLQALSGNNAALAGPAETLKAAADKVPTVAELRGGLDDVAQALDAAPPEDGNWATQAVGNLTSLVQVEGPNAPDPAKAAVAQARSALSDGDVGAAVDAVEGLPPEDQGPEVNDWLERAKARLSAQRAIAEMEDAIGNLLTATN